jgi:hypothetical protein
MFSKIMKSLAPSAGRMLGKAMGGDQGAQFGSALGNMVAGPEYAEDPYGQPYSQQYGQNPYDPYGQSSQYGQSAYDPYSQGTQSGYDQSSQYYDPNAQQGYNQGSSQYGSYQQAPASYSSYQQAPTGYSPYGYGSSYGAPARPSLSQTLTGAMSKYMPDSMKGKSFGQIAEGFVNKGINKANQSLGANYQLPSAGEMMNMSPEGVARNVGGRADRQMAQMMPPQQSPYQQYNYGGYPQRNAAPQYNYNAPQYGYAGGGKVMPSYMSLRDMAEMMPGS